MLIGHGKIWDRLKAEAEQGRLHHAQLFVGPEHTGKTKLALKLASFMQCPDESQLVLRKHVTEGVDADTLLFLDNGEGLMIEQIRKIVERTGMTHLRPYFVVVIENIGRMKPEAMNALLKTLEEPPDGSVFFLTANNEGDILETIRSRSRVTQFGTVNDLEMLAACRVESNADELVMYAMGRPGKLMRLIADSDYLKMHREMNHVISRFLEDPDTGRAFEIVRSFEKSENLQDFLDIFLHRARTIALSRESVTNLSHLDFTVVMEDILGVKQDARNNVNSRLLLENLLLPFTS
ncbi:AAA family ATPase [Patescibacteria group bacterium]|nr:AAA family ATPase [Patescibacteria group bacterium]